MATPYTHKNIEDVKDSAPDFGLGGIQQARFANEDLETETTGFGHQRILPDQRVPFAHRHVDAEEVYVVLSGSGRIKLDDDIVELRTLDAIRIAPKVTRALEAGPEGLELLTFGPRHEGDGEIVQGWWAD